jgi:hypothetical protein
VPCEVYKRLGSAVSSAEIDRLRGETRLGERASLPAPKAQTYLGPAPTHDSHSESAQSHIVDVRPSDVNATSGRSHLRRVGKSDFLIV